MQVVTMKAPRKSAKDMAELVQRASAAANDLLDSAERVLVVYGKNGASLYYDASTRTARPVA